VTQIQLSVVLASLSYGGHLRALDETSPFLTTGHFKGHPSVLVRAARIGELTRQELAELIQDAWLSRASARRAASWLTAHPMT
jgi:hypothetical protein